MKQHITPKQLNELSEEGKDKLLDWYLPKEKEKDNLTKDGRYPLLSIGQMIEFLWEAEFKQKVPTSQDDIQITENYCDALWEAVKEVLK